MASYELVHNDTPEKVEVWMADGFEAFLLKMPPQTNQGGYCGNFNGDPSDDVDKTQWKKMV